MTVLTTMINEQWNVPRLVIAAPHGRCGKTTFTLGLLRALARQGKVVQPFKKGPDFIDPSWHTAAAGRVCRNLDSYFMDAQTVRASLVQTAQDAHFSIIEGAMGLYDGSDLKGSSSTAEIAKITDSPVILVVDATRMTRSIAALVMGYQHFDPEVHIAGVILNKVARPRHEKIMREAIEQFCGIPVIGVIPKDAKLVIPDRHLGLITNGEIAEQERLLDTLADTVGQYVDVEMLLKVAATAPKMKIPQGNSVSRAEYTGRVDGPRIGVIQDQAFSFYYPENIEALKKQGAEVISINALMDHRLPEDLDGIYIGGGFPEVYAAQLQRNESLRLEICAAGENHLPIYAECGGLIYLGRSISLKGETHQMVGLLPFDTVMEEKPQGHGYTLMTGMPGNPWFKEGDIIRGHEFHHSRVVNLDANCAFGLTVERGQGIDGQHDGIHYKRVFAAYNHLHALGCPQWAETFVTLAKEYRFQKWVQRKQVAGA